MFIDEVVINVKAGKGGDGCLAFRREKFVPLGGPYGGNGGKGGDIIFRADSGLFTLLDLRYQKLLKGEDGENGRGKDQFGKDGKDLIVKVPIGTIITDSLTNSLIGDLVYHGQEVVISRGGRGGRGNTAFKTQNNPAPNFAENGERGEEKTVKVELKLLADVGLVGYPNVGKSTIISKVSKAKPKIANYQFTTLVPNLGIVKAKDGNSFVLCDLPGLIEGASKGLGLGDKFLKHIERCSIIAHVIDISGSEGRDPIDDYKIISKELKNYSEKLAQKPVLIVLNKSDLLSSEENIRRFKENISNDVMLISAIKGEGLDQMLLRMSEMVKQYKKEINNKEEEDNHAIYNVSNDSDKIIIRKENDTYYVESNKIKRLKEMTNFNTFEANRRFMNSLNRMGLDEVLKKNKIKEGEKVNIYGLEFIYHL